ncbi:hypothetical protein QVG61_08375 [Thiohalobacter sp. IOR34]|uniref:hypothetical protein n=1 Tax=Thiohalobacter sp. IOR34 TaxID=3057176 RepID=UPI0025AFBFE2|nr:hypothetical protein [Thiohalobacter sp. IOR34]WJW74524.1 hypothetical protein QVG61_08375 [Thiohalobacter sp. IOR34]
MNHKDAQFGPQIGSYMGKPIYESIQAADGHYVFDRIARYIDDGYPLDQLAANEIMYPEGVVYRQDR